jgi:MFS family permease
LTRTTVAVDQIDSARAWLMAGVGFWAGFVVFGIVYSFGVLLDPLMAELGTSRSATSALYAISSSFFYFLGPITGSIGDRLGPRVLAVAGALAMAGGLAATAFADSIWVAYLTYGLGVGVGAACAYIPTFAILGGWFDRWRTRALGIAAAGTGCGMLVVPPLAAVLIEHVGWRGALVVLAAASGLILAACAALVRPAPANRKATMAEPLGTALLSRPFILIYASWVLATMALFVPLVFLPSFATSQGVDPVSASWLISMIGGASILGRLGIGYIPAPAGSLPLFKVSVLAMACSYAIWLALPGFAWLMAFAAVLGIAYGVRIALVAPVLIELFGAGRLGALLGAFFTATGIASLAGPMFASLAVELSGGYAGGITAAIVMGALGFALVVPVRGT